jgi:hypothetical protein
MTVSSDLNRISYAGNGTTVLFPVNYYFLQDSHLQVILVAANGTETVQTLTTNYTVTGAGNEAGGSITMLVAPPTGTQLIVVRNVPATQETDYLANDPFPAESHERALDKLTMLVQQNKLESDRALKVPIASLPTTDTELPIPVGNKLLAWNSDASAIVNFDPADVITVTGQQNSYADVFTGNGVTTNFTLTRNPGTVFNIDVSINGVTQVPNVDYILAATTLTFTSAPPAVASQVLARYSEVFTLVDGDAANVRYLPAGGVTTNVQAKLRETVSVKDFGAVGDGVADDTAAIQAAVAFADSAGIFLDFPGGNYVVSGTLEMPRRMSGRATITGNIAWTGRNANKQIGYLTVVGNILISGMRYSQFDAIENFGYSFTIDARNSATGTFWNDFGFILTDTLIIDVDKEQSVNQNTFKFVRCGGGLHIKGTSTTGIREAHNNLFQTIDTTGANLTSVDGVTGVHLLNDSNLNQPNTVVNWYAETTGSRRAYGNWNILGSTVDSTGNPYLITKNASALFSGIGGRNGSFFAAARSSVRGSDWSERGGNGFPIGLTVPGGSGGTVVSVANAPDGNPLGVRLTGGGTFRSHQITFPLNTSGKVRMTAFVYMEGTPSDQAEVSRIAGSFALNPSYTPLGNNWYLMRASGNCDVRNDGAGVTTAVVSIFTTTSNALTASDLRILGSFFITCEETALLPFYKAGQAVAYSTAEPSSGIWNQGDICWNTTPSAGGTPGWMCVTSGTPGTWKAMANLAA